MHLNYEDFTVNQTIVLTNNCITKRTIVSNLTNFFPKEIFGSKKKENKEKNLD